MSSVMHKKAIILGGTKGLGLAIARTLSNNNINPIILGSSALFEENINQYPSNAQYQELDLLDDSQVNNINFSVFGKIDYFFWVAGLFLIKEVQHLENNEIEALTKLHITSPIKLLAKFKKTQSTACHYVTIASSSSWKLRHHQALYCAVKAAKAAFMRNYAYDLATQSDGSKVLLVNPGGLSMTHFHKAFSIDMGPNALSPNTVSEIIWHEMTTQQTVFHEIQILRSQNNDVPNLTYGPRIPEVFGG